MQGTAKLFKNGRSQAVRLPSKFRFEGDEVSIHKDLASGAVILTPAPKGLAGFFKLLEENGPGEQEFLKDRDQNLSSTRKLFS